MNEAITITLTYEQFIFFCALWLVLNFLGSVAVEILKDRIYGERVKLKDFSKDCSKEQ